MAKYQLRPKILVITEGYTERNYFNKFRERDTDYEVIVRKSPDNTAKKIFRFCVQMIKELGLDLKNGDSAYCVFDADYTKEEILNNLLKESKAKGIHIILSKPCFEVFYILHFNGDIDSLAIPKDVKKEISNFIPEYSESTDYWEKLLPKQSNAVRLSRRFVLGDTIDLKRCCNGSNIYEFFDEIERRKSSRKAE